MHVRGWIYTCMYQTYTAHLF